MSCSFLSTDFSSVGRFATHPDYAQTPIIILSGRESASDRQSGIDAGVDAYLTKPFKPNELTEIVNQAARQSFRGTPGMSADQAHTSYAGNALSSTIPITLPETMANRAQSVTRSVIMRWLRGVITGDLDGYAVISGGGRTIIVLYGGELPLSAAVTRGPNVENMVEALDALRTDGPSDFFAMTYHLPRGAPAALSGLFGSPSFVTTLNEPRPQLRAMLEEQLESEFTGSIVLRYQDVLWATLLLVDGDIIGCYGSDDTQLKGTIDDAMALLRLDELDIAMYPSRLDASLQDVISFDSTSYLGGNEDDSVEATELAMIELLSEFESEISGLSASDEPRDLVKSLIRQLHERAQTCPGRARRYCERASGAPATGFSLVARATRSRHPASTSNARNGCDTRCLAGRVRRTHSGACNRRLSSN